MHKLENARLNCDAGGALTQQCQALHMTFPVLNSIEKRLHLLSSNTKCRAERINQMAEVLHVLADEIASLSKGLTRCIADAGVQLQAFTVLLESVDDMSLVQRGRAVAILRQLDLALAPISTTAKKGAYIAVYAGLEAVHVTQDQLSFEAVGSTLKILMTELKGHYQQQVRLLDQMIARVQRGQKLI